MSEIKVKLGQELLGKTKFNGHWTVKQLHDELMKFQDQDAASETPKIASMERFYLKIYGWYDPAIIDNTTPKCSYCPDNPSFRRYQDYNELLNEKDRVLVLTSKYNDFKEYEIYCAYYADKQSDDSSIEIKSKDKKSDGYVKTHDDSTTVIELCGTKKTLLGRIKQRLFEKDLCM
jgi:hypothetical protein